MTAQYISSQRSSLSYFCWTTTLSWRKQIIYHVVTHNLALHIEAVNLADGEYELVPADSCVAQEVNLNCTNIAQYLGQAPEVSLPDSAQEGKPRCIIPLFFELLFIKLFICVVIILFLHLHFEELIKNLRCMIPRYLYLISGSFLSTSCPAN